MTISEHLAEYLENDGTLCTPGGRFTGHSFIELNKVLSDKHDNFIIFWNGGGVPFQIWSYDYMKKYSKGVTLSGFKAFAKEQRPYVFMQKIDGVETIFKKLN